MLCYGMLSQFVSFVEDNIMNRIDIPSKMYHGTFSYFMQQIKSKGLTGCKENCNAKMRQM
jgi:hypothetical protein